MDYRGSQPWQGRSENGDKDEKRRSYKLTTLKINYRSTLGLYLLLLPRPHIIQWHVRSTLSCNSRGSSWIFVLVAAAATYDGHTKAALLLPTSYVETPLIILLLIPLFLYFIERCIDKKEKEEDDACRWSFSLTPSIHPFIPHHPPTKPFLYTITVLRPSCYCSEFRQTYRQTLYGLPYPWMGVAVYIRGRCLWTPTPLDWSTRAPLAASLMIMMQFEPLNRKWMALSDFIMSQVEPWMKKWKTKSFDAFFVLWPPLADM